MAGEVGPQALSLSRSSYGVGPPLGDPRVDALGDLVGGGHGVFPKGVVTKLAHLSSAARLMSGASR